MGDQWTLPVMDALSRLSATAIDPLMGDQWTLPVMDALSRLSVADKTPETADGIDGS
jgi:hypothetical protein